MAQQVKLHVVTLAHLSFIPMVHMVGENQLLKGTSTEGPLCDGVPPPTNKNYSQA